MRNRRKKGKKIQQKNSEKAEQTQYNNADENEKSGVLLSASLNDLLAAKSTHRQVNVMVNIRTKLQGEINVAEGQVKHGVSGSSSKSQMDVISKNGNALSGIDSKIGEKMGEVKKHIDRSLKTGIAEAEKAQKNKLDKATEEDGKRGDTPEDEAVSTNNGAGISEQKIDKENEEQAKPIDILA